VPIRLGGIGFALQAQIEKITAIETRTVVMGHLQRGGPPTPFDRVLATRFGTRAVDLLMNESFGCMVGLKGDSLVEVPLDEVAKGQRRIEPDNQVIKSARSVGTCFGDECYPTPI
jgi:6-phosphofructokinase 1